MRNLRGMLLVVFFLVAILVLLVLLTPAQAWALDVLGVVKGYLGWGVGALGVGAVLFAAKKFLPGLVAKFVGREIGKVLNPDTQDPVEKQLIRDLAIAAVKLAEYKIPDRGQGKERYKQAASWISHLIPLFNGQEEKLAELIEGAVAAADEELKKISGGPPSGT